MGELGRTSCVFFSLLLAALAADAQTQSTYALSLSQSQFAGPATSASQISESSTFGFAYDRETYTSRSETIVSLGGIVSIGSDHDHHVTIPQAYYWRELENPGLSWSLGRRRLDWSRFSDYWAIDIWQPHFNWNPLQPEAQGLMGVFLHAENGDWKNDVFISPIFLPSQEAGFKTENHQITSSNRWFHSPVREVEVGEDDETQINYFIENPAPEDFLGKASVAARVSWGKGREGIWFQTALAYKPMNQFQLNLDLDLNPKDIDVTVFPEVVMHRLATLEAGYNVSEDFDLWVSTTYDDPEELKVKTGWLVAGTEKSVFFGAGLRHPLFSRLNRVEWGVYRRWFEGASQATSNLISVPVESSFRRYDFNELLGFRLRSEILARWWPGLVVESDYFYSPEEKGGFLSAKVNYSMGRAWSAQGGVDVLGASGEGEEGFIRQNRANDRLWAGVSYVF